MTVINTKPLTTPDPGPYAANRACVTCGAHLSRNNPDTRCAPCRPDHRWPGTRIVPSVDILHELIEGP